jgi:hypothetical protein
VKGKYRSWGRYLPAYAYRQWLRARVRHAVSWTPLEDAEPGCTAIIGMCHRLPDVLLGNLRCLSAARWPELRDIIIVVDSVAGCLPAALEQTARDLCQGIDMHVHYYTQSQAALSEKLRLPYVFSWLSWSIGLSHARTRVALLHDYDALVLDGTLSRRYHNFVASGAAIQGIRWYTANGVCSDDKLATTFEAFVDVPWLRSFLPIQMFNQIGVVDGVSRDYDTLLEIQHRHTPLVRRTIFPMKEEALVHPSQMIHQYTMFRKSPGASLSCFAIPMIPFFAWLSGQHGALASATARLREARGLTLDFLGDGTIVNFSRLEIESVDWTLKQLVRACMGQSIAPCHDLYDYGVALYMLAGTPPEKIWLGDFTPEQRDWITRARLQRSLASEIQPPNLLRASVK